VGFFIPLTGAYTQRQISVCILNRFKEVIISTDIPARTVITSGQQKGHEN